MKTAFFASFVIFLSQDFFSPNKNTDYISLDDDAACPFMLFHSLDQGTHGRGEEEGDREVPTRVPALGS